jgi:hypothetical protein
MDTSTNSRRQSLSDWYPFERHHRAKSSLTSSVTLVFSTAVCLPAMAQEVGRAITGGSMDDDSWASAALAELVAKAKLLAAAEWLRLAAEVRG